MAHLRADAWRRHPLKAAAPAARLHDALGKVTCQPGWLSHAQEFI
jgi:hypothetical protein